MSRIEIKNLSKKFDNKEVLKSLTLEIKQGEMVALLGPSGCGKTTTLKLISGLLEADEGDIKFDGRSVIDQATEQRGAVLVFQEYLLFPHLTVEENIGFGLKMQGVAKGKRRERVKSLLELVNLPGHEERFPHELSGGQQQRIALARALAVNPKVLLLDEPISNLDANLREEMRDLIKKIHDEEKMTTIFVTHDREEALLVADRIAVMRNGNLEQLGTPEELYRNPVNRYVANFFGQANYIKLSDLNEEYPKIIESRTSFQADAESFDDSRELDFENNILLTEFKKDNTLKNDTLENNTLEDKTLEEKTDFEDNTLEDDNNFEDDSNKKLNENRLFMLRPEFINLKQKKPDPKYDVVILEGRIEKRSYAGERIYYLLQAEGIEQSLRVIDYNHSEYLPGDRVYVEIPLNKAAYLSEK